MEMGSPGHAVNTPLVDSGVNVKLPTASVGDHRFLLTIDIGHHIEFEPLLLL